MAKIFNVYVYEFSIGIGPKLISWKGKETRYTIRMLPFGGYVYTASEFLDPPKGSSNVEIPDKRYIENVNRFKQILIVLSGILMNFNIAIILFTSIFAVTKCSPNDMNGYGANYYKEADSPAAILKLKSFRDYDPVVITDISFFYSDGPKTVNYQNYKKEVDNVKNQHIINNEYNLKNFYDTSICLSKILKVSKEKDAPNTLFVKYAKYNHITHKLDLSDASYNWSENGYRYDKNTTKYIINNHYIIGMTAPDYHFANSTEGYSYGWKKMFQESVMILKAFGKLFTGQWGQLSGPIGTIEQTNTFINSGPETFILYVAVISANLFILNLIPIPPLDGFKFMSLFIESCIRREMNQRLKLFITIIGVVLFFTIFIALTLKDIFF